MNFLYPGFLVALLAIAIPIIIHLFNFRKFKRILFTNVRFLKEVKQETQSRNKLKHLLILCCRILAVSFLVLAFAQPYIPAEKNAVVKGKKAVSIYVDNSFSMDAVNENGRLMDQAVKFATEIANSYSPSDEFHLLTNDFEGKHQRLVNREVFLEYLDELATTPAVKSIAEVANRQKNALAEKENKVVYLISDFQERQGNIEQIENDSSMSITAVPIQAEKRNNLFIDSVWFNSPIRQANQPEQLSARIYNKSEEAVSNVPVKLSINGQQKALTNFSAGENIYADSSLNFTSSTAGFKSASINLTDHPVTFDDVFYLSYQVAKNIPVLCISKQDTLQFLNSLFQPDSFFDLTWMFEGQINYAAFAENNLIVLANLDEISSGLLQELEKFVANGSSLLFFPGKKCDLNSCNELLLLLGATTLNNLDTNRTEVADINLNHPLYQNVFEDVPKNIDLPKVFKHYRSNTTVKSNKEKLLTLQNGDDFLSTYNYKKGKLYVCYSALDDNFTNLARHAIYVPTLYRIALLSEPNPPLYYTIGNNNVIELPPVLLGGDRVFHLVNGKGFDIIPEHRVVQNKTQIYPHNQVREAGNYLIKSGDSTVAAVAFNYSRKESDLTVLTKEQLAEKGSKLALKNFALIDGNKATIAQAVMQASEGTKLWRWCIILVLLFLAIEILLIKFWK